MTNGCGLSQALMSDSEWTDFERSCMQRALEIAKHGEGQVSPNPPVGCVLAKDGEIIAEGWHDHLGDLHAEQAAIADAEARGVSTIGSTAFVTLEPCNHHGRTPPCTEALLWAGIKELIVATPDPNPNVRGGGIEFLKNEDIHRVRVGLLQEEAQKQMAAFMCWCKTRRPLITLKAALDINGNADSNAQIPKRFTCEESLDFVHELRKKCDAVLIGVNTVIRDDPKLTVRRVPLGKGKQPLRIILDRHLRTPRDCKLATDGGRTLILYCKDDVGDFPTETYCLPELGHKENGMDMEQLVDFLGDMELQRVLIEGGPNVWSRFLKAGIVDEAYIFHSKVNLGDGIEGGITSEILQNAGLSLRNSENVGDDRLEYWVKN